MIKNLVFDLGGVLINLDIPATLKAFGAHATDLNAERLLNPTDSNFIEQFETGKISELEFFEAIRSRSTAPIPNEKIVLFWNRMLLDIPRNKLDFLQQLSNKYRLFLLSNTNSIHLSFIRNALESGFGLKAWNQLFEQQFYSFELGLRKPQPAIFQHVCQTTGIQAQESLFIDDSLGHLESAKELGFKTLHYQIGTTHLEQAILELLEATT